MTWLHKTSDDSAPSELELIKKYCNLSSNEERIVDAFLDVTDEMKGQITKLIQHMVKLEQELDNVKHGY